MDRNDPLPDIDEGDLVVALESHRVPVIGNLDGKSIAGWNDDLSRIVTFIAPGTPLVVLEFPRTRYMRVLSPTGGPVWVQTADVKHL